ncbi:WXG100 family type VII secretion target [Promicromonospora sukumoe]|uniref:WXG100 family type VII secretion target n=1 Tax=Promicromonospora sukumoe TaxID=88382 RepID=UPI0037C6916F
MPDTPLTLQEFRIQLGELRAAIGLVRREHAAITATMGQVEAEFARAKESWNTPASTSYEDVRKWFERTARELEDVLMEMTRRMQHSYDTYREVEERNTRNLTPGHAPQNGH